MVLADPKEADLVQEYDLLRWSCQNFPSAKGQPVTHLHISYRGSYQSGYPLSLSDEYHVVQSDPFCG